MLSSSTRVLEGHVCSRVSGLSNRSPAHMEVVRDVCGRCDDGNQGVARSREMSALKHDLCNICNQSQSHPGCARCNSCNSCFQMAQTMHEHHQLAVKCGFMLPPPPDVSSEALRNVIQLAQSVSDGRVALITYLANFRNNLVQAGVILPGSAALMLSPLLSSKDISLPSVSQAASPTSLPLDSIDVRPHHAQGQLMRGNTRAQPVSRQSSLSTGQRTPPQAGSYDAVIDELLASNVIQTDEQCAALKAFVEATLEHSVVEPIELLKACKPAPMASSAKEPEVAERASIKPIQAQPLNTSTDYHTLVDNNPGSGSQVKKSAGLNTLMARYRGIAPLLTGNELLSPQRGQPSIDKHHQERPPSVVQRTTLADTGMHASSFPVKRSTPDGNHHNCLNDGKPSKVQRRPSLPTQMPLPTNTALHPGGPSVKASLAAATLILSAMQSNGTQPSIPFLNEGNSDHTCAAHEINAQALMTILQVQQMSCDTGGTVARVASEGLSHDLIHGRQVGDRITERRVSSPDMRPAMLLDLLPKQRAGDCGQRIQKPGPEQLLNTLQAQHHTSATDLLAHGTSPEFLENAAQRQGHMAFGTADYQSGRQHRPSSMTQSVARTRDHAGGTSNKWGVNLSIQPELLPLHKKQHGGLIGTLDVGGAPLPSVLSPDPSQYGRIHTPNITHDMLSSGSCVHVMSDAKVQADQTPAREGNAGKSMAAKAKIERQNACQHAQESVGQLKQAVSLVDSKHPCQQLLEFQVWEAIETWMNLHRGVTKALLSQVSDEGLEDLAHRVVKCTIQSLQSVTASLLDDCKAASHT